MRHGDETVDLVDGATVAIGDDSRNFTAIAGIGGVSDEFSVDAGEELEIFRVIDEYVTGRGNGPGQVIAILVGERALIDGVHAYAKGQPAAAEQPHAVHHAPVHAEDVAGGIAFHIFGEAETSVGPVQAAAVTHHKVVIFVGDEEFGDHQDCQDSGKCRYTGSAQTAGG